MEFERLLRLPECLTPQAARGQQGGGGFVGLGSDPRRLLMQSLLGLLELVLGHADPP